MSALPSAATGAATQTITIMVRGIALGEITRANALRALGKEALQGLLQGIAVALVVGAGAGVGAGVGGGGVVTVGAGVGAGMGGGVAVETTGFTCSAGAATRVIGFMSAGPDVPVPAMPS